ncbi:unnamed protein product [Prorocentrum cordatum]|uniref:Rab-GAP TBC domain-containing protein n=1 Tax=Prorocentrum cordatum TaxID=2364126 RepID=A0ABN9R5B7_9DINO|nr:unnamed protein product [Polarella glacialis]
MSQRSAGSQRGFTQPGALQEFCSALGIDVPQYADLQWVVEEAVHAPVPQGWSEQRDADGVASFVCVSSGAFSAQHPLDAVYRDSLAVIVRLRREGRSGAAYSAAVAEHLADRRREAEEYLEAWYAPEVAGDAPQCYYSEGLKAVSWLCPAARWEEELSVRWRVLQCAGGGAPGPPPGGPLRLAEPPAGLAQRLAGGSSCVPGAALNTINVDMPRTAGGDDEVTALLGTIRSMCVQRAAEDPELSYCQGMGMVAALFAVSSRCEEQAYARFSGYIWRLRGLWLPGFPLLVAGAALFEQLAAGRPWFQHFEQAGFEYNMYLPQAWLALFQTWLPRQARQLLLPLLEREGLAGLLATSLAVLDHLEPWLLQLEDEEDLLMGLQEFRGRAPDPEGLVEAVRAWLPRARRGALLRAPAAAAAASGAEPGSPALAAALAAEAAGLPLRRSQAALLRAERGQEPALPARPRRSKTWAAAAASAQSPGGAAEHLAAGAQAPGGAEEPLAAGAQSPRGAAEPLAASGSAGAAAAAGGLAPAAAAGGGGPAVLGGAGAAAAPHARRSQRALARSDDGEGSSRR